MKKTRYTQLAYAFIPAAVSIYSCGSFSSARAADVWCGTAPICDGGCREGETQVKTDVRGNGAKCWSGHKALCTSNKFADPCTGGPIWDIFFVGFYDDGSEEPDPDLGQSEEELTASNAGLCQPGYVWRVINPNDRVCVPPDVRAQAQADNAEAHNRVSPGGGDTCRSGFVWRAAFNGDNVCVTPATRTQTAEDNAKAGERVVSALPPISETWPTLSDGDCQLQNAKLVYHPQGYAEFTAQVRTNHAGSGGDLWLATLTAADAAGHELFAVPKFSSKSLKQNGHWYGWKVAFTFDPSKFNQIKKTNMKSHC